MVRINVDGANGNAFVLIAYAKSFSKQMKKENGGEIVERMMKSDYQNLLQVFVDEFGQVAELVDAYGNLIDISTYKREA